MYPGSFYPKCIKAFKKALREKEEGRGKKGGKEREREREMEKEEEKNKMKLNWSLHQTNEKKYIYI